MVRSSPYVTDFEKGKLSQLLNGTRQIKERRTAHFVFIFDFRPRVPLPVSANESRAKRFTVLPQAGNVASNGGHSVQGS